MSGSSYSSIEESELRKFDSSFQDWWGSGKHNLLNKINFPRLTYIKNSILKHISSITPKSLANLEVLDVGCGGGLVSMPLAKLGAKVTGIDPNATNIEVAKNKLEKLFVLDPLIQKSLSLNYLVTTAEEHLSTDLKYDIVISLEVVEHVASYQFFLATLSKLVKDGGLIIISTINRNCYSYLKAIFLAEKILRMLPNNTHQFSKFIRPSELTFAAAENHLKLVELQGISFDLLKLQWCLSKNLDTNYIATFKKDNPNPCTV